MMKRKQSKARSAEPPIAPPTARPIMERLWGKDELYFLGKSIQTHLFEPDLESGTSVAEVEGRVDAVADTGNRRVRIASALVAAENVEIVEIEVVGVPSTTRDPDRTHSPESILQLNKVAAFEPDI